MQKETISLIITCSNLQTYPRRKGYKEFEDEQHVSTVANVSLHIFKDFGFTMTVDTNRIFIGLPKSKEQFSIIVP